ncbi:MAG: hypothetical protein KDC14_10665, partial [Planctomycetes bacterium]|nr:hypothetical protein [Planctomycetota bacterium]
MENEQVQGTPAEPTITARERWTARLVAAWRFTRSTASAIAKLARRVRASDAYARCVQLARSGSARLRRALGASRGPLLRAALLVLFVEGAVWALTGPLVQRIPPGMVGVRHSPWGAGVEPRDFAAGLHWNLPGLHEWHTIDAGTQVVDFGTFTPALELRTPEGNLVGVAVAVPYRLMEGRAHRLVAESLRSSHADMVRANVEAVLLTELGRASSEDWLDDERRREVLDGAGAAVGAALESLYVEADRVLLQGLRFPAPYETKLLEIQRGTQKRRLSEASANLKQYQLIVDRGVEENSRAVQRLRDERDLELTELRNERKREIRLFEIESEAE